MQLNKIAWDTRPITVEDEEDLEDRQPSNIVVSETLFPSLEFCENAPRRGSAPPADFTFSNTQLNFCARCSGCLSVQLRTIFNWIKCSAACCIFRRTISRNRAYQARRRLRRHAPFGRTINLRPKNRKRTHVLPAEWYLYLRDTLAKV